MWTSESGQTITVLENGDVSFFDGSSTTIVHATFINGDVIHSISFIDGNGKMITGNLSGDVVTFDTGVWTKGEGDAETTTVAVTTVAVTTVPTTMLPATTTTMSAIAGGAGGAADTTTTVAVTTTTMSAIAGGAGGAADATTTVAVTTTTIAAGAGAAAGAGLGAITGDPHIKVRIPGEEPVCFDIHSFHAASIISLLHDDVNGLRIDGQLTSDRKSKNRLTVITIETDQGTTLEVHSEYLYVQGNRYDYNTEQAAG